MFRSPLGMHIKISATVSISKLCTNKAKYWSTAQSNQTNNKSREKKLRFTNHKQSLSLNDQAGSPCAHRSSEQNFNCLVLHNAKPSRLCSCHKCNFCYNTFVSVHSAWISSVHDPCSLQSKDLFVFAFASCSGADI